MYLVANMQAVEGERDRSSKGLIFHCLLEAAQVLRCFLVSRLLFAPLRLLA